MLSPLQGERSYQFATRARENSTSMCLAIRQNRRCMQSDPIMEKRFNIVVIIIAVVVAFVVVVVVVVLSISVCRGVSNVTSHPF